MASPRSLDLAQVMLTAILTQPEEPSTAPGATDENTPVQTNTVPSATPRGVRDMKNIQRSPIHGGSKGFSGLQERMTLSDSQVVARVALGRLPKNALVLFGILHFCKQDRELVSTALECLTRTTAPGTRPEADSSRAQELDVLMDGFGNPSTFVRLLDGVLETCDIHDVQLTRNIYGVLFDLSSEPRGRECIQECKTLTIRLMDLMRSAGKMERVFVQNPEQFMSMAPDMVESEHVLYYVLGILGNLAAKQGQTVTELSDVLPSLSERAHRYVSILQYVDSVNPVISLATTSHEAPHIGCSVGLMVIKCLREVLRLVLNLVCVSESHVALELIDAGMLGILAQLSDKQTNLFRLAEQSAAASSALSSLFPVAQRLQRRLGRVSHDTRRQKITFESNKSIMKEEAPNPPTERSIEPVDWLFGTVFTATAARIIWLVFRKMG